MFLSSYRNTIINQSARVFSLSYFLNAHSNVPDRRGHQIKYLYLFFKCSYYTTTKMHLLPILSPSFDNFLYIFLYTRGCVLPVAILRVTLPLNCSFSIIQCSACQLAKCTPTLHKAFYLAILFCSMFLGEK